MSVHYNFAKYLVLFGKRNATKYIYHTIDSSSHEENNNKS